MPRILISAGEASGDRLAAELMPHLRAALPELEARGVAGPLMRAAGVRPVAHQEQIAVMGVVEVLRQIRPILEVRRAAFEALGEGADLLLVVDAPDFNLPLARRARAAGIPVVFYVSPQVWAWRTGRAREIAALAEEVLCLFPFEPRYYAAHGGQASFVGHPVAARNPPAEGPPGQDDWALLPGSRRSEIGRMLPPMLDAARILRERRPGARIRLPLAPGLSRSDLEAIGDLSDVELVQSLREAVAPARACLVTSGTATLEVACLGRPMVVAYRVQWLTYLIGRLLVRGVDHIALPNLIAGRTILPEFIQRFDGPTLAEAWLAAADDAAQIAALAEVQATLDGARAAERAAARVIAALGG